MNTYNGANVTKEGEGKQKAKRVTKKRERECL